MIAGLRGLGIPAGYVSRLPAHHPAARQGAARRRRRHACLGEVWCGREAGWQEFDPTNGMRASDDHITVGYGRDYSDVAPIVGVVKIAGGQAASSRWTWCRSPREASGQMPAILPHRTRLAVCAGVSAMLGLHVKCDEARS